MARDHQGMPRFSPVTPRSRRLGRELRRLREARSLTLDEAGKLIESSGSRISRIESGEIKARPGDVMELLHAYGVPIDDDQATALLDMARQLREAGWWQRLDTLSLRYLTFIGFEAEATVLRNFEPTVVPGLLQTEEYARAVIGVGRETESEAIEQRLQARLKRQEILKRAKPLRLWAILSEAVLACEVGGPDVLREQLKHLVKMAALPNVTIQHLAVYGGFAVLSFEQGDPDLGYIETLAGELFVEAPDQINKLTTVYDHLKTLSLSPAESVRLIKERGT
jgi:transcriptional regulator with XRE-family HTH domain